MSDGMYEKIKQDAIRLQDERENKMMQEYNSSC